MSKLRFRSADGSALISAAVIVRWMLLLVLAVDLIGSPFHSHHHDGAAHGYSAHLGQAHTDDASGQFHGTSEAAPSVDAEETEQLGHSLSALRWTPIELAHSPSQSNPRLVVFPAALTSLHAPPALEITERWRPGRSYAPIAVFRALPPDGRAPPTLHA